MSSSQADVVVVLAAGQGTRMRSPRPKVLHELCGRPMLGYVLDQALSLDPRRVIVVVGHGSDLVRAYLDGLELGERLAVVEQKEQLGTGHAVQCALPELGANPGRVVVLYGDMPVLTAEALEVLCSCQEESGVALLTTFPGDPRGFGRILRNSETDAFERIVEEKDATEEQRAVEEVNVGVYAFPGRELLAYLPRLGNDNAQGEYYLTDVVTAFVRDGHGVTPVILDDELEAIGINTLSHLAEAREVLQWRILAEHLAGGVQIEDPGTTYVDWGVRIGARTRILPCTVIRAGVEIAEDCEVGPFAHLRTGTVMEAGSKIGNFTEAKQTRLGAGSKASHLTYMGDAVIGARTNIGAGTVFANYDGRAKHVTTVGDDAFVGSGTILVGPAQVGDGATTGAGAVVTGGKSVPAGETWTGVPARPHRRRS